MADVFDYVPSATGLEWEYLAIVFSKMDNKEAIRFAAVYNTKRRDYNLMLILTILGFVGISGLQRFAVNQIGMGILYFFTGGLCLIGTIFDLISIKEIVYSYNIDIASNILAGFNQGS